MGKIIIITNRLRRILDVAIDTAKNSNMVQRHGSVIFGGNTIYSTGHNSNDKVFGGYSGFPSCHAEMNSLRFIANRRNRNDHNL